MRHLRPLLAALTVAFGLSIPVGPAQAQSDGVTADPGSPAGKEYALPLDTARRQAGGRSSGAGRAGTTTASPLFGQGVGDDSDSRAGDTAPARTTEGRGPRGGERDGQGAAVPAVVRQAARAVTRSQDPGGSGVLLPILVGAVIVGVAGGIGYVLRRDPRPSEPV